MILETCRGQRSLQRNMFIYVYSLLPRFNFTCNFFIIFDIWVRRDQVAIRRLAFASCNCRWESDLRRLAHSLEELLEGFRELLALKKAPQPKHA